MKPEVLADIKRRFPKYKDADLVGPEEFFKNALSGYKHPSLLIIERNGRVAPGEIFSLGNIPDERGYPARVLMEGATAAVDVMLGVKGEQLYVLAHKSVSAPTAP